MAANLLGKNLASQLKPTAADLARYGVTAGTPAKLSAIANTLITTAKAFALNLTSHVILPAFLDDPHGAFADMPTLISTVQQYGKILDAFMGDVMAIDDPMCAGAQDRRQPGHVVDRRHAQRPVHGAVAGRDGTAGNSNVLWVLGNGYTKAGWFGQDTGGTLTTWDPTTGADDPAGT